eukprot:scaffold28451_cov37-Prasinocladus_malaysianus.AAC.1
MTVIALSYKRRPTARSTQGRSNLSAASLGPSHDSHSTLACHLAAPKRAQQNSSEPQPRHDCQMSDLYYELDAVKFLVCSEAPRLPVS